MRTISKIIEDVILVTAVVGPYPSIPHKEGLKTLRNDLMKIAESLRNFRICNILESLLS